ncbi:MAG: MarR family transcriptional regulator [Planctomycetes bacterium]|nr:MarR family transcriptional regulator [Planctomycetota bacterium]
MTREPEARRLARDLHMIADLTRRVLEPDVHDSSGEGASFTQVVILKWLDAANPRRAQDVAKYLSSSAPAATQLIARLRRKGLVTSRPNPTDGRAEDLYVTPQARTLVRRHEALKMRKLAKLYGALPETKRRLIAQGLEAAIDLLLGEKPVGADMCLHCGAYDSPNCVMRSHGFKCPTETCPSESKA